MFRGKTSLLVGSAMNQCGNSSVQNAVRESSRDVRVAKDSTHTAIAPFSRRIKSLGKQTAALPK
jgi:hypothetical protein